MKNTLLILALVCTFQFVNAQKDSFWLRSLNLMGEPKAVFALDDGYSIVLADSFDQKSQQYKGIIFFKIDPNGKTVIRKQLFKIDSQYLEQRIERVDLVNNYLLVKAYHILLSDSNIQHTTFNKLDFNGIQFFKTPTKIERYWIAGDTLIHHIHWQKILYWNINDFSIIDSIPYDKAISWNFLNNLEKTFTEIYAKNIKDKYDSLVILKRTLKFDTLRLFTKLIYNKELIRPTPYFKFVGADYLFLSYKRELVKTDTNLNIIWQSPPAFAEANIEPYLRDLRVLKNGDVLVFGDAYNSILRVPYVSRISSDGKSNYFKYHYPSPLDKFYDFDEGPKGELFFLSGSRLSQAADSIWLIKASRFGRTVSVNETLETDFISIYPNPANEILNIQFEQKFNGSLSIYNINGQLIRNLNLHNSNSAQISVNHLSQGIYTVFIIDNNGKIYSNLFTR